jgi:hypothetical protein
LLGRGVDEGINVLLICKGRIAKTRR